MALAEKISRHLTVVCLVQLLVITLMEIYKEQEQTEIQSKGTRKRLQNLPLQLKNGTEAMCMSQVLLHGDAEKSIDKAMEVKPRLL